jgi:hypothetical protein
VTLDTVIAGMHAYDQKIIRKIQDPEYVKLDVDNIDRIEYKNYSGFNAGSIILISGLVIISASLVIMLKQNQEKQRRELSRSFIEYLDAHL